MSAKTDVNNRLKRSQPSNSHRRYLLQTPDGVLSIAHDQQHNSLNSHHHYLILPPDRISKAVDDSNYKSRNNNTKDNFRLPNPADWTRRLAQNSSQRATGRQEPNLSVGIVRTGNHNKSYVHDDPWVEHLLKIDHDFSQINFVDPARRSQGPLNRSTQRTGRSHNNCYETTIVNPFRLQTAINDRPHTSNQFSKKMNQQSRKWILQAATQSSHSSPRRVLQLPDKNKPNNIIIRLQTTKNNEERNPMSKLNKSVYSKDHRSNRSRERIRNARARKGLAKIWHLYSTNEKRNMLIYIVGIMLYKFGIEAFNGSIVSLAANRYDRDALVNGVSARTFEQIGLLVGLNQACQCIGSILIAPLVKHWPVRTVLSISIFIFAVFTALLMIIDGATGGKIKPSSHMLMSADDYSYYGKYPTSIIIPIYCITGIAYGMVELIRRIIPQDIVGTDEEKLQRMDALVHVFYEISGVTGALVTGLVLIPRLGNNYSFIITPILFSLSAVVWLFIKAVGSSAKQENESSKQNGKTNYFKSLLKGFFLFGESVYVGGKIIFTSRRYFWLFPCYTLTLYIHRYIENGIAPQIAKRNLGNSEWSQIIVGGSNFGELIGALVVLFLTKIIRSPMVWLRLDSILLLSLWYLPFYNPSLISIKNAWIIALTFIPLGFGSASDDVSLNAHIQSSLSESQYKNKDVSSLGSVMAFLYSSYIILYAILNPVLGKYIDSVYNVNQTIRPAFIYTVGVQVTVVSVIIFASTFIPQGSFKLNPTLK